MLNEISAFMAQSKKRPCVDYLVNKNILSTSSANLKSDLNVMIGKEGMKSRKGPEKCLGIVKVLSLAAGRNTKM